MLAVLLATVLAQASPKPAATPKPRFTLHATGSNTFVDRSAAGPGTAPPEALGFEHGSPLSPMSPYDWFSAAPVTPGIAGIAQYVLSAIYRASGVDFGATFGIAALGGSTTNAAYWGEPLIANLDIHALSRALPYAIVFPTHAGQDDATVGAANLLGASISAPDGAWRLRAGYFDPEQSDRFVFAPPPLTSVTPSLGIATAETLGAGVPSIADWPSSPTSLPLLGADAFFRHDRTSLEVTDALLPAPSGTSARLTMGSLVFDRGDFGRFSLQLAHVATAGAPIETTTFFGTDRAIDPGPQGNLFTSTLANQRQTVAGLRAFVHPARGWDALAELGRAWYGATPVVQPGTSRPGNYVHLAIARHLGTDVATLEYHRFDPTYATVILPYGIPENVWSAAWSWPGVWLKSTYQLVDNSVVGANRAGFHVRYDHPGKTVELHASYGDWKQIDPETVANASQEGFVDGFFLLQRNGFGTYGHDRQFGLDAVWHLGRDDLSLDGVEDQLYRSADPGHASDAVAIRAPEVVLSLAHHFSAHLLAIGGYGRYEAIGTWATTPVDAVYGIAFAGVQFATGPQTALLVEARRYGLNGLPSAPDGPSPRMHGTALIVDQRIGL